MLYDKYKKSIEKLAKFLRVVKRFRVLIISVTASLLAVLTAFLCVQGVVYDSTTPPTSIVYGDELVYEADAWFKKVSYEYALYGSDEWTDKMPTVAGKYKVRAVSKRTGGGKSYGKEYTFTIIQKTSSLY